MANFKYRHTTISADVNNFIHITTDADIVAINERLNIRSYMAKAEFIENDSPDTSPRLESAVMTVLDDGRHQWTKVFTGFETQEEIELYIDYVHKNNPDGAAIAAWCITHDMRSKIEILDNDNTVIRVVHDNTALDQYTINGFVETPSDPFYVEV